MSFIYTYIYTYIHNSSTTAVIGIRSS